jgi:hypothetical protein
MKKFLTSLKIIAPTLLLAITPWGCGKHNETQPIATEPQVRIVSVDDVAESPEKFAGTIAVTGRVTEVKADGVFTLGCEDACVVVPVKFAGQLPPVGRDVVVHGQIKQGAEGRYLFDAQKVEQK